MIVCTIVEDNTQYKVVATRNNKSIIVAIKNTQDEAKELAFALLDAKKVHCVEIDGVQFL